jgi:hypothetical protein
MNPRSRIGDGPIPLPPGRSASVTSEKPESFWRKTDCVKYISTNAEVRKFLKFDLKAQRDHSRVVSRVVERINIQEFDPTIQYAEDTMKQDAIQSYLKGAKGKTPVYMICGLKIAVGGAKAFNESSQGQSTSFRGDAHMNVKGESVGNVSMDMKSISNALAGHDVEATHDFVFAYRLKQIKYYDKKKNKPYLAEIEFHGLDGSTDQDEFNVAVFDEFVDVPGQYFVTA